MPSMLRNVAAGSSRPQILLNLPDMQDARRRKRWTLYDFREAHGAVLLKPMCMLKGSKVAYFCERYHIESGVPIVLVSTAMFRLLRFEQGDDLDRVERAIIIRRGQPDSLLAKVG